MNLDFVFHHAKNAPKNGFWAGIRGVPSKKEAFQKELLEKSEKPDHLKFLVLSGENSTLQTAALDKWEKLGIKTADIINMAIDAPEKAIRLRLINMLTLAGKPNPTGLGHIVITSRRPDEGLVATKAIIAIADRSTDGMDASAKSAAKELSSAAMSVLESIALTSSNDAIAILGFNFLNGKEKLKPKAVEGMKSGARSSAVKKAAGKLL